MRRLLAICFLFLLLFGGLFGVACADVNMGVVINGGHVEEINNQVNNPIVVVNGEPKDDAVSQDTARIKNETAKLEYLAAIVTLLVAFPAARGGVTFIINKRNKKRRTQA
jgi:hypothetical protein